MTALVAFALTACGDPEPAGGALPPASEATPPPTTTEVDVIGADGPFDPSARMRPVEMVVDPTIVGAGQEFEVTYPGSRDRGVGYVLEWSHADSWRPTHLLTASTDEYDFAPTWAVYDAEGYGWDDIGIAGEGPDRLLVPDDAAPGYYRVCTANSVENICSLIEIVPAGEVPIPVEPDGGIGDGADPITEATIVDVYEGVNFYPACGNEQLEHEGVVWYQVQEFEYPEIYDRAVDGERENPPESVAPQGFAPRVIEPGPGDDIGTLVVWSDGVARFTSDSGDLTAWLVDDELTYEWVC